MSDTAGWTAIKTGAARIVRVEWATLMGRRPRNAGSNARLGEHGIEVRVPLARLTTDTGASGFGFSWTTPDQAGALLGARVGDLFDGENGLLERWIALEYPLWDLAGHVAGLPVYALTAALTDTTPIEPFRVPCYDTSLYFDDLLLASDEAAAALLAEEAKAGYDRGHRAFKIKVGRGARHMPLDAGTRRDIAIVRAVREAVGPDAPLLLDANNGYNLNLTRHVLAETAGCGVYWIEEPFYEDAVLYRELRAWMQQEGLSTFIADGEGQASPSLMDWAREQVVDVVQYDVLHPGFTRWLAIGRQLDAWGARSAPHHYGSLYGNYVACHLASAVRGFVYAEWDEATTPGMEGSAYAVRDGAVHVPALPGFGLSLDDQVYRRAVEQNGFQLQA